MLEWRRLTLVENDEFPAQSRKDIIIYRNAVDPDAADCAEQFEALFTENGWHLEWRGRISDTGHFHSRAHEIIAIVKGATILAFGGGKGKRVVLDAGDAVLVPPGLLHRQVGAWTGGVEAVGAIPEEVEWDLRREPPPDEPDGGTALVDRPCCDPILGMRGPLGFRR
jgi:uncharacterized protein YjlB